MKSQRPYQACTRCIMDTIADNRIAFNGQGLCHHCERYCRLLASRVIPGEAKNRALTEMVARIKRAGRGADDVSSA